MKYCSGERWAKGLIKLKRIVYTAKNDVHGKNAESVTGLNNVLLPTLFTLVNNIEQYC
jgi:hypothetical protein